jgi:hypothetical protein
LNPLAERTCFSQVNTSVGTSSDGTINMSSFIARDANVLFARLIPDRDVELNVSLSSPNLWGLPLVAGASHALASARGRLHSRRPNTGALGAGKAGSTLTLAREANAWIDNAAVLQECDVNMLSIHSLRGVTVDNMTGRVRWVNATATAGSPEATRCPVVIRHPIYGNASVGSATCGAADGPTDWRHTADGQIRSSGGELCIVYGDGIAAPLQAEVRHIELAELF